MKADKAPKAEPDLLNWLAERLREAYPQMKPDQIKPNRHSVCIKFAVSGLSVDVVPVKYKGDPDDRGYLFAFDGGDPVLTSIPLHLAFIRKRKDTAEAALRTGNSAGEVVGPPAEESRTPNSSLSPS